MTLKYAKARLPAQLDKIRERLNTFTISLYTNDYTPTDASVVGDFTECAWPGYLPQDLDSWAAAALDGDDARTNHPLVSWLRDGTGGNVTIYGYFVLNDTGQLEYAERRAAGGVVVPQDGAYVVEPTMTLGNIIA